MLILCHPGVVAVRQSVLGRGRASQGPWKSSLHLPSRCVLKVTVTVLSFL